MNAHFPMYAMPHQHGPDPRVNGDHYRDLDGRFRKENGNKRIHTIEKEYGVDLGLRGDMKLSTALERFDVPSQTKLLEKLVGK